MFPDSIKNEAAFNSTYTRGLALAKKNAARGYAADSLGVNEVDLTCKMKGSSSTPYDTWVHLDMEDETVLDYSCSCPAHANYYGMCKHGVALALSYLRDAKVLDLQASAIRLRATGDKAKGEATFVSKSSNGRQATATSLESYLDRASGSRTNAYAGSAPRRAKPEPQSIPTSASMDRLIATYAAAQRKPALVAGAPGAGRGRADDGPPAELDLIISRSSGYYGYGIDADPDGWEIKLKVRRGKASYVVKSVGELIDNWKNGALHEYGKNLAFVHSRATFSDRANRLIELLEHASKSQRVFSLSLVKYSWGYGHAATAGKSVLLSNEDAIAALDIMAGASIVFEHYEERRGNAKDQLQVVEGAPEIDIELQPTKDGGYDLHPPDGYDCIVGEGVFYVLGSGFACRSEGEDARLAAPLLKALFGDSTTLHVSQADLPAFCSTVLPALKAIRGFVAPEKLELYEPPEVEMTFKISESDGIVTCEATVFYDDVRLGLFAPIEAGQPYRDAQRELVAQQLVRDYFGYGDFPSPDYTLAATEDARAVASYRNSLSAITSRSTGGAGSHGRLEAPWFPADDAESMYYLMAEGLAEFAKLGDVLLSERLRAVEVRRAPVVDVEASVKGGLLDLDIDAAGMTPAELVDYLGSYRRHQRYIRLDNGDIMRLDDSLRALSDLADGLGITPKQLVEGSKELPANRTLFVDELMKETPGVRFNRNEAFRSIVRDFDTIADSDFVEPDSLRSVLRSYQRDGFKWLSTLSALGFGGILADDMGLGKTLQLISLLLANHQTAQAGDCENGNGNGGEIANDASRPSLVVCPASLVYNWIAEIARFAPELDAVAVVGPKRERVVAIGSAADHDVLVTSYDLMKRDVEAYEKQRFDIVALDEAHYIKNSTTQAAKAAKRLDARVRFALTGTPIENRLSELWSIFDFLMAGILGSREAFARRFEKPITSGDEGAAARLRALVGPFILRRLKADVLSDLPDKNESVVLANMDGEQDKLYKATASKLALSLSEQRPEEFAASKIAVLAELTKLRQICCDPHLLYENYADKSAKLETCMELLGQAIDGGHQVLLFSQFTSMLDIIAERLESDGVGYLMLTGSTSREERARRVERFQAGQAPVFLISLKAGGVGLNLTAADIVIHFDPWWNLAAQNQATDRAHRIGQTRDVTVFKLISKGTIEEKIVKMQEAKRDLAEQVIGGDSSASTKLTREDVLALLDA